MIRFNSYNSKLLRNMTVLSAIGSFALLSGCSDHNPSEDPEYPVFGTLEAGTYVLDEGGNVRQTATVDNGLDDSTHNICYSTEGPLIFDVDESLLVNPNDRDGPWLKLVPGENIRIDSPIARECREDDSGEVYISVDAFKGLGSYAKTFHK